MMTYKELKEILDVMTPYQLDSVIYCEDNEGQNECQIEDVKFSILDDPYIVITIL